MADLLEGRRAVVTGAASGVGRAVVEAFRHRGAEVLGLDIDRSADIRCDVSDERDVAAAFDQAVRAIGSITDVIHAAGVPGYGDVRDTSLEEWRRIIDVNLTGAFLISREAVRYLETESGATLTIIGSRSGRHGAAGLAGYCASKFGVIGLVESLAREVGADGIRVNVVVPYGIDTPMAKQTFEVLAARQGVSADEIREADEATIPLGRYASSAEIANVCVWLASDLATYVNGASIPVDGGAK
jgi:NAD(P)-dependent dehydrogenase (short-subunit alcohol dehydrogenase family)